jgi:hypothetical protein
MHLRHLGRTACKEILRDVTKAASQQPAAPHQPPAHAQQPPAHAPPARGAKLSQGEAARALAHEAELAMGSLDGLALRPRSGSVALVNTAAIDELGAAVNLDQLETAVATEAADDQRAADALARKPKGTRKVAKMPHINAPLRSTCPSRCCARRPR